MKHPLSVHCEILKMAAHGRLPVTISGGDGVDINVVRELMESGYMNGINANSTDGLCYMEPRITIEGREYLARLEAEISETTLKGRLKKGSFVAAGWLGGILTAAIIAWLTKLI